MTNHRQPDGAPPGWQEAFLGHLRETGNVSAAARAAGTCRSRCYEWRRRDPAFVAAWADALEEAADRLEMEAFRRAVKGVGEDRFFQGSVVGEVTRYSDSLLMFLLRARRPARFGTGAVTDTSDSGMENDDRYLAELCRRMETLCHRRNPADD